MNLTVFRIIGLLAMIVGALNLASYLLAKLLAVILNPFLALGQHHIPIQPDPNSVVFGVGLLVSYAAIIALEKTNLI